MTPAQYLEAARCPPSIQPGEFGLWKIERLDLSPTQQKIADAFATQTVLSHWTEETLHKGRGDIVMEDSRPELRKHLPIWMNARGRVLITGLGLGCVVRGLLANPNVERIDVVEIDRQIIDRIWPEFAGNDRATIHHADAMRLRFSRANRWDCAWHDLWTEDDKLTGMHIKLFAKFMQQCEVQGAWALPREIKRAIRRRSSSLELIG